MRRTTLSLVPLLLLSACATLPQRTATPAATSAAQSQQAPYIAPGTLDLAALLPPPPAAGSAAERAELDAMLRIQEARTPAQAERAHKDEQVSIWRFADALGNPPAFNAKQLPVTGAFFARLQHQTASFSSPAKDVFGRPRPFRTEPRLKPVVEMPPSASYPSGHSTWAHTMAVVLADMLPEYRAQIFSRADEYAHNRIVGGVHYPSDVEAGALGGTAIAAAFLASPHFQADEAAAAAELRAALGLPPLPRSRH